MNKNTASSTKGSILVVIGPNGYGKTTYLESLQKEFSGEGHDVISIPSEIKLLDEVKDTVDSSKAMEVLLAEIIETPEYISQRDGLFAAADQLILDNQAQMNELLDEVLSMNGSTRTKDFISPNPKHLIKNLISIEQTDIKKKMGSGQRMQLLLKMVMRSTKTHVFLDEPEKYSHPSLLNGTAKAINELVDSGKNVYIATHSPKLISMLELDFGDIRVINDESHSPKPIPFDDAVSETKGLLNIGSLPRKFARYYEDGNSLKNCIVRRHNRSFIEALFAKRIYLCEGANDELFVNEALQRFGGYYDDYCIFKTWGKTNLPVFIKLFLLLGVEVVVLQDKDNEEKEPHKTVNPAIKNFISDCALITFNPNLEKWLSYTGEKGDALGFLDHLEEIELPDCCNIAEAKIGDDIQP